MGGRFAAPEPIFVRVAVARPVVEVLADLQAAVASRRYSVPIGTSPGWYRLGGSIIGTTLNVTASPYAMPGLIGGSGSLRLRFNGAVRSSGSGTEIVGYLTAPFEPTALLVLVGVATFVFLAAATQGVSGLLFAAVMGPIGVLLAWLAVRRNQRMALANAPEFERLMGGPICLIRPRMTTILTV